MHCRFTVKEIYAPRGEMSLDEIALRRISPKRFEYYTPEPDESWKREATQLSLDGFDIRSGEPPNLLPKIRLARIFWPRHMLCLPIWVDKKALDVIDTERPRDAEIAQLMVQYDETDESADHLVRNWRAKRRQSVLRDALRANGYDPDPENMDWERFEDPQSGEALEGAEWRKFYQVRGYDMVLTAEHDPQNLRLGLWATDDWWADDCRDLIDPRDDLTSSVQKVGFFNVGFWGPDDFPDEIQVMPVGEEYYIAKGFGDVLSQWASHPVHGGFEDNFVDMHGDKAWELLSIQMEDWKSDLGFPIGHAMADPHIPPALRPCFDSPDGWAPAPDRSLASAMLRSLALAKGAERLDQMLIRAVNLRVECLARMKDGLEQTFERGLIESGYKP